MSTERRALIKSILASLVVITSCGACAAVYNANRQLGEQVMEIGAGALLVGMIVFMLSGFFYAWFFNPTNEKRKNDGSEEQ